MSIVFTPDENGKVTPVVEPPPRISPELATRIAAEIDRQLIELGSSSPSVELMAEIIERVGNNADR